MASPSISWSARLLLCEGGQQEKLDLWKECRTAPAPACGQPGLLQFLLEGEKNRAISWCRSRSRSRRWRVRGWPWQPWHQWSRCLGPGRFSARAPGAAWGGRLANIGGEHLGADSRGEILKILPLDAVNAKPLTVPFSC